MGEVWWERKKKVRMCCFETYPNIAFQLRV